MALAGCGPDDDLVTMLWDASFDHLFFQAVDSFADGNQDQRARYEADRANVLAGAKHPRTENAPDGLGNLGLIWCATARAYCSKTSLGEICTKTMVVEMCEWPINCMSAGRLIPARTISEANVCLNRCGRAGAIPVTRR